MRFDAIPLVWIGFVDDFEVLHELHITADGADAARARGWMVLTEAAQGIVTFNPPRLAASGDSE